MKSQRQWTAPVLGGGLARRRSSSDSALFGRSSSPPLFVELARGDEQARELSRVGPVGQLHPGGRRSAQVDGNRLLPGGRRAAQVDGNPLFSFLGLWHRRLGWEWGCVGI